jgi:hypothetical protein
MPGVTSHTGFSAMTPADTRIAGSITSIQAVKEEL